MIYQRQKVLLMLLREAPNKRVSKIQFIKWLFLLKEEENIDRYVNFYSFFPYKYGPFSFLAYKDISELESFGWITNSFQYNVPKRESTEFKMSPGVLCSVESIIENYGGLSQQSLVRYVYEKYPWYASRSVIEQPSSSVYCPRAQPAIYSLGYQGVSIDSFLDIILKAGIQKVIDSRYNPVSRKYGFSKSVLADKCHDVGIRYHQFSEVGIPSKIRHQVRDIKALWSFYTEEILAKNSELLESIANICMGDPSVLICFERRPEDCHRHIMARELSIRTKLPIIHYVEGRWEENGREGKSSYSSQNLPHTIQQV